MTVNATGSCGRVGSIFTRGNEIFNHFFVLVSKQSARNVSKIWRGFRSRYKFLCMCLLQTTNVSGFFLYQLSYNKSVFIFTVYLAFSMGGRGNSVLRRPVVERRSSCYYSEVMKIIPSPEWESNPQPSRLQSSDL